MSTIGIVGGLGPEGTVHYYRKLAARLAESSFDHGRPGIVVDHVWMDRFASLLRSGAERGIVSLLAGSVVRLHRAGAEIGMIAAVTPHKFLASVQRDAPIPLVDLVEATQREVTAAGHRAVGLLGTRLTLTDAFFKGGLERAGIRVTVPDEGGISYLDDLIFGPLASGSRAEAMTRGVQDIVRRMASSAKLDALVVGCTDLMDLLAPTLPLVDPIDCHIRAAVALARSNARPRNGPLTPSEGAL